MTTGDLSFSILQEDLEKSKLLLGKLHQHQKKLETELQIAQKQHQENEEVTKTTLGQENNIMSNIDRFTSKFTQVEEESSLKFACFFSF